MQQRNRRGGRARGYIERPSEPAIVAGRVPPNDLEAEAAVLSAITVDNSTIDKVIDILKPEYFWSDANRLIYQAVLALLAEGKPFDIVTITTYLRSEESLSKVGGPSYLCQISDATPSVHNVRAHAEILYDKWVIRRMIATGQLIAAEGYGDIGPQKEWLGTCEQRIFEIVHRPGQSKAVPIGELIKEVFQEQHDAAKRGERITGLSTGFEKVDEKTTGLHDGDLTIVAARPGIGKTSWAMNLAVNVASPSLTYLTNPQTNQKVERDVRGKGVAVFSLEMPRKQLAQRMLCSEARIDVKRFRSGLLQPEDWRRMGEAAPFIQSLPIWIDDTPAMSVLDVRAKVRRLQAEFDREATERTDAQRVGLVIVDYIQLMSGTGSEQNREQEISGISRGLKQLAKELKVPVVALSQLNRAVETRSTKDKRPQLSDLRESGALEQDADNVFLLYRDDYYNEQSDRKGIAELDVAKQRNGPTGRVFLRFEAACTRFDNLAFGDYPQEQE